LRLLLDTNILIMIAQEDPRLPADYVTLLGQDTTDAATSTIAVWEIGIKHRLGKLALSMTPEALADLLPTWQIRILPLLTGHALHDPDLAKDLKDPFDRMFVAIAERERMNFLTTDKALHDHPLAWRP
jgi:PIN domain nuclease of toxin-antitoxin system